LQQLAAPASASAVGSALDRRNSTQRAKAAEEAARNDSSWLRSAAGGANSIVTIDLLSPEVQPARPAPDRAAENAATDGAVENTAPTGPRAPATSNSPATSHASAETGRRASNEYLQQLLHHNTVLQQRLLVWRHRLQLEQRKIALDAIVIGRMGESTAPLRPITPPPPPTGTSSPTGDSDMPSSIRR